MDSIFIGLISLVFRNNRNNFVLPEEERNNV